MDYRTIIIIALSFIGFVVLALQLNRIEEKIDKLMKYKKQSNNVVKGDLVGGNLIKKG